MIRIEIKKRLTGANAKDYSLVLNAKIQSGERVAIYGPSGVGKTTILRMVAGLTKPDQGIIQVGQQVYFDGEKKISLAPQKRNVGMVFQEYSLFPNMTVDGNLKFALKTGESHVIIEELLEVMELASLRNRNPHLLSGGQKQRVALARALVRRPEILLLDEPFSAIDSRMKKKLQAQILKVYEQLKFTTFFVSHDLAEIRNTCTRVLVIENGELIEDCPSDTFMEV